jgi:glycosyltransferase involved in cell wall biosynthesis
VTGEPAVSVVIPTVNRPYLVTRALSSVFGQSIGDIEVIVVLDGPDEATRHLLDDIRDPRLRVLPLRERRGLGHARNSGVREARCGWVALLDDDDEWLPEKLERQLSIAHESRYRYPIVSCRFIARGPHGDVTLPRRVPTAGEHLSEYLFCQTRPLGGEGLVLPSTILAPRQLMIDTPFRHEQLPHESSDWLLRAVRGKDVGVAFVPHAEPLVIWHAEGTHSRMSASDQWRTSLEWLSENADLLTPRARAGFVLTRVSLEARRGREWGPLWLVMREAFKRGRPTFMNLLAHLSIWLVPEALRFRLGAVLARKRGPAAPLASGAGRTSAP